jgi:hypothetical protein
VKFKEMLLQIRPTDFMIHNHNRVSTTTNVDSNNENSILVELFRNNQLEKYSYGIKDIVPKEVLEATFIKMRVELYQRQTNAYLFFCSLVFTLTI